MPEKKWFEFNKRKTAEQKEKDKKGKAFADKLLKMSAAALTVGAGGYEVLTTAAGYSPTIESYAPGLKDHRTFTESMIDAWEDRVSVEQATTRSLELARELGIAQANNREHAYGMDSFWDMEFISQPAEFTEQTISTERGPGSVLDVILNNFTDPMAAEDFEKRVFQAYHDAYNTQLNILFLTDIDTVHSQAPIIGTQDGQLPESGLRQAPMLSLADFYSDPRILAYLPQSRFSDEYRELPIYADTIRGEYDFYTMLYTESLHADLRANSLAAAGSISETPMVYAAREFRFSASVQDLLNNGDRVLLQGGLLFEPIMGETGQLERIQVRVVPVTQTIEGGEQTVELTPYQLSNPIDVEYNYGVTNGVADGYYAVVDQIITYQGGYDFSSIPLLLGTSGIIGPEGADGYPVWRKVGEGEALLDGVDPGMLNAVSTALFQTFRELGIDSIPVITSGTDGAPQRVTDTAHTDGDALDIRVNQFNGEMQFDIAEALADHLPSGCQVILETPRGRQSASHTHIHVECEPQTIFASGSAGDIAIGSDGATAAVYLISLRGVRP